MSEYLLALESVSECNPDKLANRLSDTILEAILEQDLTEYITADPYGTW